jgi:hypothetical protein
MGFAGWYLIGLGLAIACWWIFIHRPEKTYWKQKLDSVQRRIREKEEQAEDRDAGDDEAG